MTRDYYKLEPDRIYLLKNYNNPVNSHYTPGRAGAKTEFITRHHLMYIGEVEDVVDNIWDERPASAHVVIGSKGRWGQAVYDRDTAWANADQWANRRTIAIEHSNCTGRFGGNDFHDKSWNISDETVITGARVAAAYCLSEGLGKPVYGKNVRDHNEFTATGCPVHLQGPRPGNAWGGKAGKYHYPWMEEATHFYDLLSKKLVKPDGTPIATYKTSPVATATTPKKTDKGVLMALTDKEQKELLALARDIKAQLTGSLELGQYPGWAQLGGRTLIDGVAFVGKKLQVEGFKDVKEAKND